MAVFHKLCRKHWGRGLDSQVCSVVGQSVFDCICGVLRGSLLYISCGLSAVKINEELLLLSQSSRAHKTDSVSVMGHARSAAL